MMKPLFIEGMGILFSRGRGLECFSGALKQGWVPPDLSQKLQMGYRLDPKVLKDNELFKRARRADRYSKIVVMSAYDALYDSGFTTEDVKDSMGIINATAFGSHATTTRFLDDTLEFGDSNASPTIFSHSIHNAAASYVASILNCNGPTFTVTQFHFAFQQALLLAYAWLNEGRCERVLVGGSEECGPMLEYVCSQKLNFAEDGKIKPLACSPKPVGVPGEGSVFFMLSLDPTRKKYGAFTEVSFGTEASKDKSADLTVLNSSGMLADERVYRKSVGLGKQVAGYSPIYGSMMTGATFECAVAALMLEKQTLFGNPVCDTECNWKVDSETKPAALKEIECITYDCAKEKSRITLER